MKWRRWKINVISFLSFLFCLFTRQPVYPRFVSIFTFRLYSVVHGWESLRSMAISDGLEARVKQANDTAIVGFITR